MTLYKVMKWFRGTEKKITEKVKEEKHITPLQQVLELIHFTMYKIKKKA